MLHQNTGFSSKEINPLLELLKSKTETIDNSSYSKLIKIIEGIPAICNLSKQSIENRRIRSQDIKKMHPIRPSRGDIYNAYIEENVGSELSGSHLVLIVQNQKGNIYGEKVNVLPIEGDGNSINPNYQVKLTNQDLEFGNLTKDPSRIIMTDILTIDKSRLDNVKIGKVKPEKLLFINDKLKKQLGL